MNITAINQALVPLAIPGTAGSTDVALPTQQHFSSLLNAPEATESPDAMLNNQKVLSEMLVGVDLTAKVAGSLTQTINKLVNMS